MRPYVCLLVAATSAAVLVTPAPAQSPPDVAGVWTLNAAESDTIALPATDSSRGQRRGVRVRIGRWAGGMPPHRSIQDPERMRQAIEAVLSPPGRIILVRDDSSVTIAFDAESPITLRTDGDEEDRFWIDGEEVEVRARWKDGALRIERKLANGLEIVDAYAPAGDARLVVHTVVEGPIPRRIELRRVYDRAPPDPDPAPRS